MEKLSHVHDAASSPAETPISPPTPLTTNALSRHQQQQGQPEGTRDNVGQVDDQTVSPIVPRDPSQSADRNSTSSMASILSTQLPVNLTSVRPEPAYVASFGATQVLGEGRRSKHALDDDASRFGSEDMHFSPPALALVNSFLDQLLFSFLFHAKSTSLTALRPAVQEVLKSKLAAEAIASAEEELHELLAGGEEEEEEINLRQTNAESNRVWDLELIWKRTRLRVMVYTRLGEVEDDDEERYVREEELLHGNERRFSQSTGLVSWAAAIFLTTVLEYVAEQVVRLAAQAARTRARRASKNKSISPVQASAEPSNTVEEHDMEKVALSSSLGRLWRTWRKSLRAQNGAAPQTPTKNHILNNAFRDSSATGASPGATSFGTAHENEALDSHRSSMVDPDVNRDAVEDTPAGDAVGEVPEAEYPEHVLAANIPLPMRDSTKDIEEIEVPGLARDPDEEGTDGFRTPEEYFNVRRNSLSDLQARSLRKPLLLRHRSNSVPTSREALAVKERRDDEEKLRKHQELLATAAAAAAATTVAAGGAEVEDEGKPEPKCNAEEMAALKREASPGKSVEEDLTEEKATKADTIEQETLEQGANKEDAPEAKGIESVSSHPEGPEANNKAAEDSTSKEESLKESTTESGVTRRDLDSKVPDSEKESSGIVAGAVAGASAVAAAALSLVYGSSEGQKETPHEKAQVEEAVPQIAEMSDAERNEAGADTVVGDSLGKEEAATGEATTFETPQAKDMNQEQPTTIEALDPDSMPERANAPAVQREVSKDGARTIDNAEHTTPVLAADSAAKPDVSNNLKSETAVQYPHDEVDKRDLQKNLLEIKRMSFVPIKRRTEEPMAAENSALPVSDRPSAHGAAYANSVPRPDSVASVASEESFSLLPKTAKLPGDNRRSLITEPTDAEEGFEDEGDYIGVAQTSDTAISTPRGGEDQYVTDGMLTRHPSAPNARRFSRLILGMDDAPSPIGKGQDEKDSQSYSEPFPRRSVSPVSEDKPKSTSFQQRAANRMSAPANSYHNGNVPDKATWRQSFSATLERNGSWSSKPKRTGSNTEPQPDLPVHDHPVIQRMASLKHNSKMGSDEKSSSLTSASIKGPEDFEMFVQGGDTVKYTLTPENVRDDTSPVDHIKESRDPSRSSSPTQQNTPSQFEGRKGRSQSVKHATSAAAATSSADEEDRRRYSSMTVTSKSDKRRSISRPPVRNTSVHRRSGLIAREPQVMTESTRDFADFIRSTGPDKEPQIYQLKTNRSTASLQSTRMTPHSRSGSRSSSPGAQSTRSMTRTAMADENVPPVPSLPGRESLTPRDPYASREGNSDLIDFIRSGPGGGRQHRISRSVAPFRSTLDSDQMNEWGDRIAAQPDLKLVKTKSKESRKSWRNSMPRSMFANDSSSTGEVAHPAYSGQTQSLSAPPPQINKSTSESTLGRHQVRNKDPYVIDLDDEDDDLLTALPKNRRDEETMVDFLRNTGPTADANGNGPRRSSAPTQVRAHGADIVSMKSQSSPSTTALPKMIPKTYAPTKMEARPPSSRNPKSTGTGELSDFLRSSGPASPGNDSLSAPAPGVSRTKSASAAPLSSSSKQSKTSKTTKDTGSTTKRRWWAIFSSKKREGREADKRKDRGYLDM